MSHPKFDTMIIPSSSQYDFLFGWRRFSTKKKIKRKKKSKSKSNLQKQECD